MNQIEYTKPIYFWLLLLVIVATIVYDIGMIINGNVMAIVQLVLIVIMAFFVLSKHKWLKPILTLTAIYLLLISIFNLVAQLVIIFAEDEENLFTPYVMEKTLTLLTGLLLYYIAEKKIILKQGK